MLFKKALEIMKHSQILSCLVCLINILLSSVSVVYPVIKDTTTNK